MHALAYRLRSAFARRRATALASIIVVGIVAGMVLACAAGARRTMSAPDRFTVAAGGDFGATITQQDGGAPLTQSVSALDGVESAESITFVFGVLQRPGSDSNAAPVDGLLFAGTYQGSSSRLVEGRAPDPNARGEFVATPSFVRSAGATIGDTFHMITLTQAQADSGGFDAAHAAGPELDVTLVGVIDGASQIADPTPMAIVSPAVLALGDVGVSQTIMAVRLRPGVGTTELRAELDTLPDTHSLAIGSGAIVSAELRSAVRTQAVAMWVLALVAAAAAFVVLGQIVFRFARLTDDDHERLIQIGFTERMVLAEAMGRAIVVAAVGAVLAAFAAIVPSRIFPTGLARRLDPRPGTHVDALVLCVGALAVVVALTTWTFVALSLERRGKRPATRPSTIEGFASRSPSAALSTGLRFAFGHRAPGRSAAAGRIIAVAGIVALLVGTFEFGVSLNRLLDQPFRYGVNHDLALGDDGSVTLSQTLVDAVEADHDVKSVTLYATDHARRGSLDVSLLGMTLLRGQGAPTLTSGRLPSAPDEIVLGRNTAHDIGATVGDTVELIGASSTQTLRVTGIAVIPGFGANEGVGSGGVLTMDGLLRLNGAAQPNVIAVQLDRTAVGASERLLQLAGASPGTPFRPAVIVNVSRVRNIPMVLAALIAALGLLTVVNVVGASVRSRHRDLAILRALGANGRWLSAAVRWQTTLLSMVPAVLGVLVGIVAGRQVFMTFAGDMGAITDADVPFTAILTTLAALVVLANLTAALFAHRVRRVAPALRLHVE